MTEFALLLAVGKHWLLIVLVALAMFTIGVAAGVAEKRRLAEQPADPSGEPLLMPLPPMQHPADYFCAGPHSD